VVRVLSPVKLWPPHCHLDQTVCSRERSGPQQLSTLLALGGRIREVNLGAKAELRIRKMCWCRRRGCPHFENREAWGSQFCGSAWEIKSEAAPYMVPLLLDNSDVRGGRGDGFFSPNANEKADSPKWVRNRAFPTHLDVSKRGVYRLVVDVGE